MRHRVAYRKLGRVTEHRIAMLRNQATALIRYEHLTTTVPRAKELRPFVERLITIAKRGVAGGAANGHALTARRLVMQDLQDRAVVAKLFETIAPRFASRAGGYTRLLRLGYRKGDSAEVAQIELIGSEFNPRAKSEREAAKDGTLVLLPSHKSHIDYMILAYLFYRNYLPLPIVAAGDNLSFFPLGPVFRRAGAFFIRRSFHGDRLDDG